MSKYLVSLGVVWVIISLIIGIVLVVSGMEERAEQALDAARANSQPQQTIIRVEPEAEADGGNHSAQAVVRIANTDNDSSVKSVVRIAEGS